MVQRYSGSGVRVVASQAERGKIFMQGPGFKKAFSLKNKHHGSIYDTIYIPTGTVLSTGDYDFFKDVQGKPEIVTNLQTSRRLTSGDKLLVKYVGIYIRQYTGVVAPNQAVDSNDIKALVETGYLTIELDKLPAFEGPLFMAPCGYGLSIVTTKTDRENIILGMPSTASVMPLLVPKVVSSNHDIKSRLQFQTNTSWMPVGSTWTAKTTTTPILITLILAGKMLE